jgi:hypothetical protein
MLESIGDESQINDLNGKRYYVQSYEMKLMGYLVDTEEFEVKPAINRVFVTTELESKKIKPVARFIKDDTEDDKTIKCVIQFLPGSPTSIKFNTDNKTNFTTVETENITTYTIYRNGDVVSLPFTVEATDDVQITIVKTDSNKISEITLRGLIIV